MVAVTVKQVAARVGLPSRTDQKVAEIDVKIAEFVAFRERLAEYRAGKRSHDEAAAATARSAHASMTFSTRRLRNER